MISCTHIYLACVTHVSVNVLFISTCRLLSLLAVAIIKQLWQFNNNNNNKFNLYSAPFNKSQRGVANTIVKIIQSYAVMNNSRNLEIICNIKQVSFKGELQSF